MRTIDELARSPADLDFSSSGQGACVAYQVQAGAERITNAANLVDWTQRPTQLVVCEFCGCSGCTGGNYVSIRRLGQDYVLLPAFEQLAQGEWERHEYAPPAFLEREAGRLTFATVERSLPELAAVKEIEPLSCREAGLLVQWEAPEHALGRFPAPVRLDAELTFVVSDGEPTQVLSELERLVTALVDAGEAPVVWREARDGEEVVSCFVDGQRWIDWTPLVRTAQGLRLHVGGNLIVDRGG